MGDEHAEKIAQLENIVFKQGEVLTGLNEKNHQIELELCKALGTLERVSSSQSILTMKIEKNFDKSEDTEKEIYKRFTALDNELKKSFTNRDQKITELRIDSAKVNTRQLTYAGVAFTIITTLVQYLMTKG